MSWLTSGLVIWLPWSGGHTSGLMKGSPHGLNICVRIIVYLTAKYGHSFLLVTSVEHYTWMPWQIGNHSNNVSVFY